MDTAATAQEVLEACGGKDNILSTSVCMTRLRLELANPDEVDEDRLKTLHGVLGLRGRNDHGLEVVFGPAIIDSIATEFSDLIERPLVRKAAKAITRMAPTLPSQPQDARNLRGDNPSRKASYAAQRKANRSQAQAKQGTWDQEASEDADLDELRRLLEGPGALLNNLENDLEAPAAPDRRLLVINGPNLNMLGVREPDIYGHETYSDLVDLCHLEGARTGFSEVRCFQSNHEGAIVDVIQDALNVYDAIVINPAAYTHTSVAILDALKAVAIPAVEVHISDVSEREDFRQVSYVRPACIATVMGEGFAGYGHAMRILARCLDESA